MDFKLEFHPKAEKAFGKLPDEKKKLLTAKLADLAHGDFSNAKKLKPKLDQWRVRAGKYRAVFSVDGENKKIYILRIAHRREAYRNL